MSKLKILNIYTSAHHETFENYDFWNAPSFTDYDVIIIDPQYISEFWEKTKPSSDGIRRTYTNEDGGFGAYVLNFVVRRQNELISLLNNTNALLICFLRKPFNPLYIITPHSQGKYESIIDIYSWIPEKIFNFSKDIKVSEGKVISWIDKKHPFSQYFKVLRDNIHYEVIVDSENLPDNAVPLAKNRVGEIVAFEIPFDQGRLILLPPASQIEDSISKSNKIGGVLIDCIKKALDWQEPIEKPDWINRYTLPGEEDLRLSLHDLEEQLKVLNAKKKEIQEDLNKIEKLKSILYGTGKYELEPAVRDAFRVLGFNVLDPDEYDEDYDLYIKEGEIIIIGEIQGTVNQVDISKYRQLLDYISDIEREGKKCKGILIGNGYRKINPEERGEQFTESAIIKCEKQGFCRMATTELFKAVSSVLSDAQNYQLKQAIRKEIFDCKGEFKFENIEKRTKK